MLIAFSWSLSENNRFLYLLNNQFLHTNLFSDPPENLGRTERIQVIAHKPCARTAKQACQSLMFCSPSQLILNKKGVFKNTGKTF